MTTSTRQLFVSAAIAFVLAFALVGLAQEPAPSTPAVAPDSPAMSPAPATTPGDGSAAAVTPAPGSSAETVTPTPATPAAVPAQTPAPFADSISDGSSGKHGPRITFGKHAHHSGNEIVNIGGDSHLAAGGKADAVVAVFGSASSEGDVADSIVSVMGNTRSTGSVGQAAVAVFGDTYIDGKVGDVAVAVSANFELGPNAEVNGDVVSVGGGIKRDPKAIVHGDTRNIKLGPILGHTGWLRAWFFECAMYGRMLAFRGDLMWAWWIALAFLGLYVVLGLLFGNGVNKCVGTFEARPGYSILAAVLTVLLAPVVTVILAITGVGFAVIPFLGAALFFAGLFGKAVFLAWIGRRLTRLVGIEHPAFAILVGGIIVLVLYTVPVLGMIMYKLTGWMGLGIVMYTLIIMMKREKRAVAPVVASSATPAPTTTVDPLTGALVIVPVVATGPGSVPPIISAATLPRAGFWIRTAALALDLVLVGALLALVRSTGKLEVLALAAYGACMWKLRGSTIGGIVCGLKVVRLDDRPIDWTTAIVRALGCFLSLIVIGLGFIWVAFDEQKQSWHDKIAGTTVVRVPKGVSLV